MPILSIRHLTRYRYRKPVAFGEHRMMFRPLESDDQRLLSSALTITPAPSRLRYTRDVFGNCVGLARFATRARDLVFDSRVTLDHRPPPAFVEAGDDFAAQSGMPPSFYGAEDMPNLAPSMERRHPDPEGAVERWARSFMGQDERVGPRRLLADMTRAIHGGFRYASRPHGEAQPPAQTLASRTGACRDFALLMMDAARSLGFAAQFVSGYIHGPPRRAGVSAKRGGGHTHAWVRVYLPACGWVEFDPTNGAVGAADLVRVAIARDPRQALPLCGIWRGEAGDFLGMDVEVEVTSEEDSARPAAAYRSRRQPGSHSAVRLTG